jgi:hypothetical protein
MTNENATTRPRRIFRRIFKVLGIGGALLLFLAVVAHYMWMYSGSNQWEPAIDKNGIKIYTLKAPGNLVKRLRGVTRVKTTMNAAVSAMMSTDLSDCKEWFPRCGRAETLHQASPQDMTRVFLFSVPFRPFPQREFMLKGRASQDPVTKAVLVEYNAVPDEVTQNACCYRITHMANSWRFTPLPDGWVEVENRVNMDIGVPYFMFNRFMPGGQFRMLGRLQKYLDKKKDNKFEGIKD